MKQRVFRFATAAIAAGSLGLAGCSSSPEKISAAYVSPIQYSPHDCNQLGMELIRVNRKVIQVSGMQKKEADKDAVAMGVGLVLFWPALFFLTGSDHSDELARLKGEYEALETAAIQKKCDIANQLKIARLQQEKAMEKDEESRERERDAVMGLD